MYECNKCYHQFSGTPSSLAACNCCEDGSFFESIQPEEREVEEMMLNDKRTPTCPHCGMAKLETSDIVDTWDRTDENGLERTIEHTIGVCPNCNHTFDYLQIFTHEPVGYECVDDITEDEEDEEDDA